MDQPLATIERLAARVGEPIESAADIALANAVLEEASNWVRLHGLPWPNPETAPGFAVSTTVNAAARGYQNPSGLATERAEVVTLGRAEDYAKGTELTAAEIHGLQLLAGTGKKYVRSVPLARAHMFEAPARQSPMVPVQGQSDFPYGSGW